ncbi:hypothetical protein HKX48_004728 [Thoreauomyces humboldtii]|nr:hypothetical protein HKX48_004728 [Thoreauomyces humboldtii]
MATSASPQLSAGLGLEHSNKGVNGPYLDLLAPPVDLIHPLLGRMHPASLRLTFDNEILGCIKRMRAFASKVVPHDQDKDMTVKLKGKRGKEVDPAAAPLHVSPNTRRRLLSSQLTKCWDMFGPHIDSEYLYTRMVEAGESILTIDGFWDVARTTCFERILEEDVALSKEKVEDGATTITSSLFGLSADSVPGFAVPVIQESAPDTLLQRARYGVLVCKFHALQAVDPLFKSARVVSDMLDVAREILDVVGECYDLVDQNQVGYLVWQGTRSVRNMCELIGGGGWWSEVNGAV